MKTINTYITERLKLSNKNPIKQTDKYDPTTWNVGDIMYCFSNHIEFYRILRMTKAMWELQKLDCKLTNGAYNSAQYTAIPLEDKPLNGIWKMRKGKYGKWIINGPVYKSTYYEVILWEGDPVTAKGNMF